MFLHLELRTNNDGKIFKDNGCFLVEASFSLRKKDDYQFRINFEVLTTVLYEDEEVFYRFILKTSGRLGRLDIYPNAEKISFDLEGAYMYQNRVKVDTKNIDRISNMIHSDLNGEVYDPALFEDEDFIGPQLPIGPVRQIGPQLPMMGPYRRGPDLVEEMEESEEEEYGPHLPVEGPQLPIGPQRFIGPLRPEGHQLAVYGPKKHNFLSGGKTRSKSRSKTKTRSKTRSKTKTKTRSKTRQIKKL
jgi:hypothetical protein